VVNTYTIASKMTIAAVNEGLWWVDCRVTVSKVLRVRVEGYG